MASPLRATNIDPDITVRSLSSTPLGESSQSPSGAAPTPGRTPGSNRMPSGHNVRRMTPAAAAAMRARNEREVQNVLNRFAAAINLVNNPRARNDLQTTADEADAVMISLMDQIAALHTQNAQLQQQVDDNERHEQQVNEAERNAENHGVAVDALVLAHRNAQRNRYQRVHPNWVPGQDARADWEAGGREGPAPEVRPLSLMDRIRMYWNRFVNCMREMTPFIAPTIQILLSLANLSVGIARLAMM